MGALEQQALRRLVDDLAAAGVTLPPELGHTVNSIICGQGSTGARLWAAAHPDLPESEWPICCPDSVDGPDRCICWEPVYEVEQATPRPPAGPQDLQVAPSMCGDCAYRPGSPERRDSWMVETLMELPVSRQPFWCHQGMRRPSHWVHPDGRTVAGDPDDWQPPMVGQIPYRADGSPGLLCAGWAAIATARREADQSTRLQAAHQILKGPTRGHT